MLHPSRLEQNLDRASEWIEDHVADPFFVLFHTYEPHEPYLAPVGAAGRIRADWNPGDEHDRMSDAVRRWKREHELSPEQFELVLRHSFHCQLRDAPRVPDPDAMLSSGFGSGGIQAWLPAHPGFARWLSDAYDAEIAWSDEQLGRLWKTLEDHGLRRHTWIIVVSDHGEALGDHQEITHGMNLHTELTRIVLMLCAPDDRYGPQRIDQLVRLIDVMPTALALLKKEPGDLPLQGRSLVPLLVGDSLAEEPALAGALSDPRREPQRSLRTERWSLLVDTVSGRRRLYDRERDPQESFDVARHHPMVVADLTAQLRARVAEDASMRARLSIGVEPTTLDEETRRELRALGYIDAVK